MPQETTPEEFARELVPNVAEATATIGGSLRLLTEEQRTRKLRDLLNTGPVFVRLPRPPPPPPPPPPPLPEQLGPFAWNPIVFSGGVPVGGWAQLTLFRNGTFNFVGHFHDSGATSYDVSCVFAVRDSSGTTFTFSHRGRVHGTFESGSRDDDWGDATGVGGPNQALAAAWPQLAAHVSWSAKAGANFDLKRLVDDAVAAVRGGLEVATAVIAIV